MRILMVGAGAIGGYLGARLVQAGKDVTFLVRPGRAKSLNEKGLVVRSPLGDATIAKPALVSATAIAGPYDLVIVTCKAFDLPSVLADIASAVGPDTTILPLLNGMAHLDVLDARFGAANVFGGSIILASTIAEDGAVVHLGPMQSITFGERDGSVGPRANAVARAFEGSSFAAAPSPTVLRDMWNKWVFLASLASTTCLMRAPIGAILAGPGGPEFLLGTAEECRSIAAANGFAPPDEAMGRTRTMLTTAGSPLTASLMRDMEKGGRIEADHIIGDLLARGQAKMPAATFPNLRAAYLSMKAYENRQAAAGPV